MLIEKDEIISEDNRISEIFNDFFHNAVASLNVDIDDPVLKAIERYNNHPSITKIKEARKIQMMFEFNFLPCMRYRWKLLASTVTSLIL